MNVTPFFEFCLYMLKKVVSFFFSVYITFYGVSCSLGDFVVACAVLSVVICVLLGSLRSASLAPEARMGNARDAAAARASHPSGGG